MHRVSLTDFKNKKIALVLSGGVIKAAAWHVGVGLALEELGFTFKSNFSRQNSDYDISTYVGSSAGALISLFYASGYRPIDIVESTIEGKSSKLKPLSYRDIFCLKNPTKKPPKSKIYDPLEGFPIFFKNLLKPVLGLSGFFTTQGLYDYIKDYIIQSNNYNDYKADLFVVATQLDHSRKVIFGKYNYPNARHDLTATYYTDIPIAESVAASMSVPPFFAPYPVFNPNTKKTDYYIDGEIRETLSTHVAIDNGCEFIISSWTHTPYHYHDEIGSLINYGLPAICTQAIYLMIQKKIVTHRSQRKAAEDIINTINDYLKSNRFPDEHRKKITSIIERKMNYNPNVHLIDIYPNHKNYGIFFKNSFSLNSDKMFEIVKMGYKRTLEVFKNHEWES